jgi:hypothetical protein
MSECFIGLFLAGKDSFRGVRIRLHSDHVEVAFWEILLRPCEQNVVDFVSVECEFHGLPLVDGSRHASITTTQVNNFFMLERDIERYLVRRVEALGGRAYKFVSPGRAGVADRIVCLPNGQTWFVEVKTEGGRLSALQKVFAEDMMRLNQRYVVVWNKEQVDEFTALPGDSG